MLTYFLTLAASNRRILLQKEVQCGPEEQMMRVLEPGMWGKAEIVLQRAVGYRESERASDAGLT